MPEPDKEVVEFMQALGNRLIYFLDNEKIQSFDLKFEYKGKDYQLVFTEIKKISKDDFTLNKN